ncbi:MAG: hypothetical protein GY811_22905 [Myxococcales bacterium]|nr:hypothetical protein [Myxococcales bacterium]
MIPQASLRSSLITCLLLSAACTAGPAEELDTTGPVGKGDSLAEQRCASALLDISDVCRASDGTYAPAECCQLESDFEEFECNYDDPGFDMGTSVELRDFVVETRTVEYEDYAGLTSIEQQQIHAAAAHLSFLNGGENARDLFGSNVTDDENYILSAVVVDGDSPFRGDWVRLYAGDTEVGVVFDIGTTTIVAEVSDGDLMQCSALGTEPSTFTCSYDVPEFDVDNSYDLRDYVVASTTIESDDFAELGDTRKQQLYLAAVHLSFMEGTEPLDSIFEMGITDDENFIVNEIVIDSDVTFVGDWVKFYAGDTEVGVIFEASTTAIVGEVSDGDIMACEQD